MLVARIIQYRINQSSSPHLYLPFQSVLSMSVDAGSVEVRLLALETRIGLAPKSKSSDAEKDISSRLSLLEDTWKSSTTTGFKQLCDESDNLLEDLQPGAGLTYQQELSGRSKNYPILYRKQLVLASKDTLRNDMKRLSDILNLLYISQKSTLKDVAQAPIINTPPVTPEQERRLDAVRVNAAHCQRQTSEMANKVDSLMITYQKAMLTLSGRMIQLEQEISQLGK